MPDVQEEPCCTPIATAARNSARKQVPLPEGTPQAMLSAVFASGGYQLRHSPVGFRSQWHCTPQAAVGLHPRRGRWRSGCRTAARALFKPGEHFYLGGHAAATGATFDAEGARALERAARAGARW